MRWNLLVVAFLFLCGSVVASDEVVVYSSRNEQLIKPIFAMYTKETGTKVTFRTDKEGALMQRIKAEDKRTRADILLTVDAGNLWQAKQMGLLQPVDSGVLTKAVPETFRDPEGFWFGFSLRARTIVYNKNKVKPSQLTTYAALAGPEWKGKLLLRTSKKVYNQSLTAMLMAQHGEAKTEGIVKGWVNNLAAPPFSNDTSLIKALASGVGEVGIVNTYYLGRLLKNDPELPVAVFWPDQSQDGVHVNISGAGLVKHAKNRDAAIKLLEWLTSAKAQKAFAGHNMEFPVVEGVALDPIVAKWGTFTPSKMNLAKAGELQGEAIKLMDRAGYK